MRPLLALVLSSSWLLSGCAQEPGATSAASGAEDGPLAAARQAAISTEVHVDPLAVIGDHVGPKGAADVAFDGTHFLVVWPDNRGGGGDIYGARVDAAGNLLDPVNLVLSADASPEYDAAVTFDGTNYLVVWSRLVDEDEWDVFAARVTPEGVVLDPGGFPVSTATKTQRYSRVVSGGTNSLVVWTDNRTGIYGVYGARIDPQGAVLDPDGILVAPGPFVGLPDVAFVDGNYVAVFADDKVQGARVDPAGQLLDPAPIQISTKMDGQVAARIASDGVSALVVWNDTLYGPIVGRRIGADLAPLDAAELALAQKGQDPDVGFGGTSYLAAWWPQSDGLESSLVDPSGAVTSLAPTSLVGSENDAVAVAGSPSGFVVANQVYSSSSAFNGNRIQTIHRDAAGAVVATTSVSRGANVQWSTGSASNGKDVLFLWQDNRLDMADWKLDLFASRLDGFGVPVGEPTPVAADANVARAGFDGTSYWLAWQEKGSSTVYASRMGATGKLVDAPPKVVAQGASDVGLACRVGECLFVWKDSDASELTSARLSPDGTLTGPTVLAALSPNYGTKPSVAASIDGYLVAWNRKGAGDSAISALRLDAAGVVDAAPIEIPGQGDPYVASDGTAWLVTWCDLFADATKASVVGADGALTPVIDVLSGFDSHHLHVVFDGSAYLVAGYETYSRDVWAAYVDTAGAVLGDPFYLVQGMATAPTSQTSTLGLTSPGGGQVVVSFARAEPLPEYGSARLKALFVGKKVLGQECLLPLDCPSGYCFDGVCCDSDCGADTSDCQACSAAAGSSKDGACEPTTGTVCDDGEDCTSEDVCQAGTCVGSSPGCEPAGECQEAVCIPTCAVENKADGTPCAGGECVNGQCAPDAGAGGAGGGGGNGGGETAEAEGCGCGIPGGREAGGGGLLFLGLVIALGRRRGALPLVRRSGGRADMYKKWYK